MVSGFGGLSAGYCPNYACAFVGILNNVNEPQGSLGSLFPSRSVLPLVVNPNTGNATSLALPTACLTVNFIDSRSHLVLAHNTFRGVLSEWFKPPAIDAAKCQSVPVGLYVCHGKTPSSSGTGSG